MFTDDERAELDDQFRFEAEQSRARKAQQRRDDESPVEYAERYIDALFSAHEQPICATCHQQVTDDDSILYEDVVYCMTCGEDAIIADLPRRAAEDTIKLKATMRPADFEALETALYALKSAMQTIDRLSKRYPGGAS